MAQNKTHQTTASVTEFLQQLPQEQKRLDSLRLMEIFKAVTGFEAKMWGLSIIGFGSYHYQYESGHEGDMPIAGFSPRKEAIVLYLAPEFPTKELLLSQLGKHKTSKACIYVKKLAHLDEKILITLITDATNHLIKMLPIQKPF